jgi:zinc transport system substrate-binding protein
MVSNASMTPNALSKRAPRTLIAVLAFGLLPALLPACGGGTQPSGRPKVAVSIFPLYDIARRIAGDQLEVVLVLPAGRSEHSYRPTPREVARLSGTRLAVGVGLHLDSWLTQVVRNASENEVEVLELGPQLHPRHMSAREVGQNEVPAEAPHDEDGHDEDGHDEDGHDEDGHDDGDGHDAHEERGDTHAGEGGGHRDPAAAAGTAEARDEHGEHHEHHHGGLDPHFWLDPVRMIEAVDLMVTAFIRLDPAAADSFRSRGDEVKRSLRALDERLRAERATFTRDTIITFHGSFGYFADRYNLHIAAVVEPSPGREPTARYLAEVLAVIAATHPAALFSEPQLDPRPAQVIAQDARLPLFELDPVGGTEGVATYEELMLHNGSVLARALR